MREQEERALRLEIKAREYARKKIEKMLALIEKDVAKVLDERRMRKEKLTSYHSEQELQDDYGWGFISEEEYYSFLNIMRNGAEAIDDEVHPTEIALHIMKSFYYRLGEEIASFEFDLKPAEEQISILEENERILAKREERRKKRMEEAE